MSLRSVARLRNFLFHKIKSEIRHTQLVYTNRLQNDNRHTLQWKLYERNTNTSQKGLPSKWNVDSYLNQRHAGTEKYDRTPCLKTKAKRRSHYFRVPEKISKWHVTKFNREICRAELTLKLWSVSSPFYVKVKVKQSRFRDNGTGWW
jgi:hypothetical protein